MSIFRLLRVCVSALGEKKSYSTWWCEISLLSCDDGVNPEVFQVLMLQSGHILTAEGITVAIMRKTVAGQPLFEHDFNCCRRL